MAWATMLKAFTWSWSRHRAFERCRRRYWYDYYGSKDGWRAPVDDRARTLYEQKRLVGFAQVVGQQVHEVAGRTLLRWREGEAVDRQAVIDDAGRAMRRVIDDALRGMPHLDPRRYPGFEALYYGPAPTSEAWDALVDDVQGQVAAWWDHPLVERARAVPQRIREVERLERVVVGSVPVWVSLDLLVEAPGGRLVVVDWKTGQGVAPEEAAGQLGVYALYVHRRYDVPADRIVGVIGTTRDGAFTQLRMSAQLLRETSERIEASAALMEAALATPDQDVVDEASMPKLPEGAAACVRCRYRRACGREADR